MPLHAISLHKRALALPFSLAATPALAFSDATQIPPPPYLVQPIAVLLIFLAIFVGAAWSLSTLMGVSSRPLLLSLSRWRRRWRI